MITVLPDTFECVATYLKKKPPPLMLTTINKNKGHVYTGPDIFLPRKKKTYTVTIHFAFIRTGVTGRIFERLSVQIWDMRKAGGLFYRHDFSFVRTSCKQTNPATFCSDKAVKARNELMLLPGCRDWSHIDTTATEFAQIHVKRPSRNKIRSCTRPRYKN